LLAKHADMVDLGASPSSGRKSARGHSRGRSSISNSGGGAGSHTRSPSANARSDYLATTADDDQHE
jgi:hypothetical protein